MPQSTVEHTNPSSVKTPVVIRPDYVMYLEFFDGLLWFHTDIHRWSCEVKRKYTSDIYKLLDLVDIPLVAAVDESNTKLKKFAETFGWKVQGQIMLNNGNKAFIYASA